MVKHMKDSAGFTLIEMICTIVIIGILATMFTGYFSSQALLFSTTVSDQDLNQNARVILERMASEVRQAATMTLTSSSDFSVTADINGDGVIETVRYYLSGSDLHRVQASDQTILQNVSTFQCALTAGNTILSVQNFTFSAGGVSRSFATDILMRRKLS
jgi:prepilin-type N-terminal cleavage/methylation domain-containing protein